MKRSPWLPLFCATLLAGTSQTLRAQDAFNTRYPVLTREAAGREAAIREQIPALPVSDSLPAGVLPTQIKNLPDVSANLKVVHRRSQLIVAKSNVVRTAIADPGVVDVVQYSPNELSIIGMSLGSTTVTMWFDDGSDPLIYLVETIRDPSLEERRKVDYGKLEKKLTVLFPNSKVYLIPMSGKIIVKGQAKDSEESARILNIIAGEVINQAGSLAGPQPLPTPGIDPTGLINPNNLASSFIVNMLDVPGEFQVMLRVRIAQIDRSQLRKMGVNIAVLINDGQQFFSSVLAGAVAAGTGNAAAVSAPLTGVFSSGDVSLLINALAANGSARILAEPAITVLSGHPASFLSGGEFAVPTIVGIQGVGGQQTTFRGFGTSLIVTPTVLDKDNIRMQILPEYSQVNNSQTVNGIPGINTRRVQTTVQLREGQTIALAGLIGSMQKAENNRIPYLGEIPVLGPLFFSAKQATEDETELIILVTPEIVRPMEPDEVPPLPGHEVTPPDDCQFYWHNMIEGPPYQKVVQLAPYGHNAGHPEEVGYTQYNPSPASPGYHPAPLGGAGNVGPGGAFGPQVGGRYPQGAAPAAGRRPIPAAAPNLTPVPVNPAQGRQVPNASGPSASRFNMGRGFGSRTASAQQPAQYSNAQYSNAQPTRGPQYSSQQYGSQQYGQPSYSQSQYGQPQYNQTQYQAPADSPMGHTIPRGNSNRY